MPDLTDESLAASSVPETGSSGGAARGGGGAMLVGLGILLSRLAGLVRERIFAHYLGNSDAADVFKAALRIPNFLQNLFGEGVLSASFIPVYARLQAEGKRAEAVAVARFLGLLLLALMFILVLIGISATPILIDLITPGFEGEKRRFAIRLVQIFFPATAVLVMSAWCLGVLNSHGRFFLSYSAPVIWNLIIVAGLLFFGARCQEYQLAVAVAWSVVIGSLLQTAVQLPSTFSLLGGGDVRLSAGAAGLRRVLRGFGPVVMGRGVVQISAYVDSVFASLLPTGALAALAYAQTIYLLPVSLFGMSISAAALPQMAGTTGTDPDRNRAIASQLDLGLSRIAYFIVPSVVAFLGLGDCISQILFQSGRFTYHDTLYVWGILAGSTVGLLAVTMGRLYASVFYALNDTRTPFHFALLRVSLAAVLGYVCALRLPVWLSVDPRWGVAALTASSGLAGWMEFYLLRRKANKCIGHTGLGLRHIALLWGLALSALLAAFVIKFTLAGHGLGRAALALIVYTALYLLLTWRFGVGEAGRLRDSLARQFAKRGVRL